MSVKRKPFKLVVSRTERVRDSMNIYFKCPNGFSFKAGDWLDFFMPDESELRGGKTYSFASSPTEDNIMISFRLGISQFKQYLQSRQNGDVLNVSQYGNSYDFYAKDNRTSVFIAGGIGIAPFRSMLKEMNDERSSNEVQLLYFNKDDVFLFQDEINEWARELRLDVHYIQTDELKRKDRLKVYQETMRKDADLYYIAGPEAMVKTTTSLLTDTGIESFRIRTDSFEGY